MSVFTNYARAINDGDLNKVQKLYKSGARDQSVVVLAIERNHVEIALWLIQQNMGATEFSLYYAKKYKQTPVVNAIVDKMIYSGNIDF